jgi:hypothetical protein
VTIIDDKNNLLSIGFSGAAETDMFVRLCMPFGLINKVYQTAIEGRAIKGWLLEDRARLYLPINVLQAIVNEAPGSPYEMDLQKLVAKFLNRHVEQSFEPLPRVA